MTKSSSADRPEGRITAERRQRAAVSALADLTPNEVAAAVIQHVIEQHGGSPATLMLIGSRIDRAGWNRLPASESDIDPILNDAFRAALRKTETPE